MALNEIQLKALHQRFPKRRAAITGAGSGLGKALALELAKHNWTLWLNDCDGDALELIADKCGAIGKGAVVFECFDVSDLELFISRAKLFLDNYAGVDVLFTCAGIGVGGPFVSCNPKHIREVVDINILGTMWAVKAFVPSMIKAQKGSIVTIASAAAFHGLPHLSAYAATKAAVVQFSETIRSELKPHNIDITTKMTTFYTSNIAEFTRGPAEEIEKARSLVQLAPWSADQVADALLLTVQKRQFYMVAPGQAKLLWRFKRFFPQIYLRLMPAIFRSIEAKLLKKAAERSNENN
ncbi:MAG: short-subunit dehydrogenase [Oleiphilaceae bacterium]|jgi:short-subunit dehydrogenase